MISSITIGFSKPKDHPFPILAWAIQYWQKTPYSHVYVRFYSESINRTLVYEAVGKGVRFISLDNWTKHAEEVKSYTLEVKKCNAVTLLQYCVDHSGDKYGMLQNLGIFLAKAFSWKKNPWTSGKNCSEAISEMLQAEGMILPKNPNLMSPLDVDKLLARAYSSNQ